MNSKRAIRKFLSELESKGSISGSDVLNLLTKSKNLMDENSLQGKYPIVAFYRNWSQHISQYESKIAFRMMEEIIDAIVECDEKSLDIEYDKKESKTVCDRVNEILLFDKLRKDLLELFDRFNLNTILFKSKKNWKVFTSRLLKELEGKPMGLPDVKPTIRKTAQNRYNSIGDKVIGSVYPIPKELSITFVGDKPYWKITTLKQDGTNTFVDLTGPICMTESDKDFPYL